MPKPRWLTHKTLKARAIRKPPVINPEVLEWFASRTLSNHDAVKNLTAEQLDAKINELSPKPEFYSSLFKHQKAMFLLAQEQPAFMFFSDLGTGKTATALNIISYKKAQGQIDRTLVLVPDLGNIGNWVDEVKKHAPHLKVLAVHGTKQERLKILNEVADIYVLNYVGLQVILDTNPHTKSRKRMILPRDIIEFSQNFDCIIFDEITCVKGGYGSITYKICDWMSKYIPYRYGLTGVPIGRQPLDLWPEFNVIDRGETLGKSVNLFRQTFFTPEQTMYGTVWHFNEASGPQLNLVLKNRSIRYSSVECVDLPPSTFTPIKVTLDDEARGYYKKIIDKLINDPSDKWLGGIQNHFIKLRQICSGFLRINNDKEDEDMFFGCNKDKILQQLIEELPENDKIIIFHEFINSGKRIANILDDLKFGYRIYGGDSKLESIEEFRNNPAIKGLVINSHSGAIGLNLQVANYTVFYETPVSPIVRANAEKRTNRTGQTKHCYYFDLVTKSAIEEKIMGYLKEGKDLFQVIIEGKRGAKQALVDLLQDEIIELGMEVTNGNQSIIGRVSQNPLQ